MNKRFSIESDDLAASVAGYGRELAGRATSMSWREIWQDAAKFGLLTLGMPVELGGDGGTARDAVRAMEAFGEGFPDNGLTMGMNSQLWTVQEPLRRFGSAAQQARYLPDLIAGKTVGAFALTEADAGSDAMNMAARAERTGAGYVLDGEKCMIGMAPVCDVVLVFAMTAPEHGAWGVSAFLVEQGDPGFVQGASVAKHGLTTLPFGSLRFENCEIPEDRRLGPEGAGARIFQAVMDWERSFILAPHVGAMRRQVDSCAAFAADRAVFGQPIAAYQSVSNRLADMRVRLETARLMLHDAARAMDEDRLTPLHAAMTNLHLSEAFLDSSLDAFRTYGGRGYLADDQAGMDARDALGGVIYSGTSDIQRQVIARLLAREVQG